MYDHRVTHEVKIQLLALACGLPAVVAVICLLYFGNYDGRLRWTVSVLVVGTWLGFAGAIREKVASPLRTLANLLEAMREGDYSIRARDARADDAMGEVMQQVNAMGTTLRAQRLGALEATTLLRKVMEEIDVAIFAFDANHQLRLLNRTGERLIGRPAERALGSAAEAVGLAEFLGGEANRTVQRSFPGGTGRWGLSRSVFREGGLPHQLLVVTDLTRPLREEELQAWQRLVRVLGHELNNSLTPIKSIAESLSAMLKRTPRAEDWEEDMTHGLEIIATRSEGLSRFLGAYARLAKLPRPTITQVRLEQWIERVTSLERRLAVVIEPGPNLIIPGDPDQLDQLLINLVRNAADASLENGRGVTVGWTRGINQVQVWVRDEGPGVGNTSNLFVPFFTTKPGGSGIGLVLSRQIAEAHGGSLDLRDREDSPGAEAVLVLPL